jgi:Cdc6-like AAA superfamily ATPase
MASDYFAKMALASQTFTPGSPINRKDLFSGRQDQIARIAEAVPQPGRHPIVYGQRGVGKTSLANIVLDTIRGVVATRVSCDGSDNFKSIWNRVLSNSSVDFRRQAFGLSKQVVIEKISLADFLGHDPKEVTPSVVASVLRGCVIRVFSPD